MPCAVSVGGDGFIASTIRLLGRPLELFINAEGPVSLSAAEILRANRSVRLLRIVFAEHVSSPQYVEEEAEVVRPHFLACI